MESKPTSVKPSTVKNRLNRWRSIDRHRIPILVEKYGPICWYCGLHIPTYKEQSVDHVISLASIARQVNPPDTRPIALACRICNQAKANLSVAEFEVWVRHIRSKNFSSIMFQNTPTFDGVLLFLSKCLTWLRYCNII